MKVRADQGWIRAGLAVLVVGLLGGGVLAARGTLPTHKVTADGVTSPPSQTAAAQTPLDLAGGPNGDARDAGDAPKADPAVGDKVAMGSDGGSVTVSAVEDNVSAGRLFGAGQGFKYIGAEVKGCSGPNEKNITFEPAYFLLKLDDGTMHDHGPGAKKPELEGGTVPAGKCLSGWVTFTVPEGALPTGVVYDGSTRTTWTVPLPKGAKQTTTTTLKPGATTPTSDGPTTTTTSKPKSTTTTTKPKLTTTTTAVKSTSSTTSTTRAASTASTAKPATTTTTGKATTTTTAARE